MELHRPGIEPWPPAWQASILPLNHRCLQDSNKYNPLKSFKKNPENLREHIHHKVKNPKGNASAGNLTRAACVAGEHSTTEPPMPTYKNLKRRIP